MRWNSWLPRLRLHRLCVAGLDVGLEGCRLFVLAGSPHQPDSVCCAERLSLPEGWVSDGEVLQPVALGQWLRNYLVMGDYQPMGIYIGLDNACVSNHLVTLAAGLSPEDVSFQLQAEVQSLLPDTAEVCIDHSLDNAPASAGEQRYLVQAVPRHRVASLQSMAKSAGLRVLAIEPCQEAARRVAFSHAVAFLPQASAALAWQCEEAFGLALRAWQDEGSNFVPHSQGAQGVLQHAWLLGVSVCAMGGAFLAAGFAMVMTSVADAKHPHMGDVVASARALEEAQQANAQAKAVQERNAEQVRWLKARQELQAQSLQWSQVLSHAAQGVWVASVTQQGSRWTAQGEALSSNHAHQLVKQLKALDIWTRAPELPQLQMMPSASSTGLPVWQFRIEADLKVGV